MTIGVTVLSVCTQPVLNRQGDPAGACSTTPTHFASERQLYGIRSNKTLGKAGPRAQGDRILHVATGPVSIDSAWTLVATTTSLDYIHKGI